MYRLGIAHAVGKTDELSHPRPWLLFPGLCHSDLSRHHDLLVVFRVLNVSNRLDLYTVASV